MADQGVKEINLIAQDMSSFGMDRGRRGELIRLLRELVRIPQVRWIRLLYLYPHRFPEGLLELMAEEEKICRYIDLPLQHICDEILVRMNRGGKSREIHELLDRIRKRLDEVVLRTTFIVGFPGETSAHFQALCDFVRSVEFDRVGVFTYSSEEGTPAYDFRDEIPMAVKLKRRERLMAIQAQISRRKNVRLIGTVQSVLIEGPSGQPFGLFQGRTMGQAPEVDGCVYLEGEPPEAGTIVPVEITQASHYDLVGRVHRT